MPWEALRPQTVSGTAIPDVASTPDGAVAYKVRSGPRIGTFTPYASHDGGVTWQQLGNFYGTVGTLLVDPADPADIYVTAKSSFAGATMIVSHDGGQSWTTVAIPDTGLALAGDPTDPAKIWLGGPNGLWSSVDGGTTFAHLDDAAVSALDRAGQSPGHRRRRPTALQRRRRAHPAHRPAARPGRLVLRRRWIAPRPGHGVRGNHRVPRRRVAQGGHGVLASTDGGRTWAPYVSGLDDLDVSSLAVTPAGDRLFAGTVRGGVFTIALPPGRAQH